MPQEISVWADECKVKRLINWIQSKVTRVTLSPHSLGICHYII